MNPSLSTVQAGAVMALATGVLPHVSLPYALGTAAAAAGLLAFMAQESDRAAERRIAEINRMQDIFRAYADALEQSPNVLSREADSRSRDIFVSMTLPDLDERRREHLPVLVAIHEAVEAVDATWGRQIERDILDHLAATAESRALVIPPLG